MKKILFLFLAFAVACTSQREEPRSLPTDVDYFLGTWALTADYESFNAGWLEVKQEDGYLDADLLWRGGSVSPVEFAFFTNNQLFVTRGDDIIRDIDADGNAIRTLHKVSWWTCAKEGDDEITGYASFPANSGMNVTVVNFRGKRLPEDGPAPDLSKVEFEEPVSLIQDESLNGWKLIDNNAKNGWSVKNGVLENNAVQPENGEHISYGNLRTEDTYEDFNLTLEVNVPEGSNSGVYLRGIYEIQVVDSYGNELDPHNMGALYSRITPAVSAEKPAGEWQKMDITLVKRHVTVYLNNKLIIDNQPVRGVTGGAMTSNEFIPGPIYLQGDHGIVQYRNIQIRKVKE